MQESHPKPKAQTLKTLEFMLDVLPSDESAQDGMRALFEKRSHEGHPPVSGDPVRLVAQLVENKTEKLNKFSDWVAGRLDDVPEGPEFQSLDIPQENLLEGLFRWCCYRPDPKRYAEKMLKLKDATTRTVANGWTAPLRRAFKHALISNQVDDSLQELWLDLLDGTKPDHDFQRYWPDDFEGLLHMPAADGGGFAWSAIGRALRTIYDTLLPGYNNKSLSPSGPMRNLYRRLGSIADLDEPDLSLKLWELAAGAKWSEPQEHTLPDHFFKTRSGGMVVPRLAISIMLSWKNITFSEMGVLSVVMINKANFTKISDLESSVIEEYETTRKGFGRRMRFAVSRELFVHHMHGYFDLKKIAVLAEAVENQRRTKIKNPFIIQEKLGSALFSEVPLDAFEKKLPFLMKLIRVKRAPRTLAR